MLAVAGYYGNALYSDAQANKALSQMTHVSGWQWQKDKGLGNRRSSDVQWRIDTEDDYVMRRVGKGYIQRCHLKYNNNAKIMPPQEATK